MINDFYKTIPRKRVSAGALIFNEKDEILFVKPNYKQWTIPGGMSDENESPKQTCVREVKEEVGLELESVKLLCVDYVSAFQDKSEALAFIFYGDVLSDEDIRRIKLQEKELDEWKFMNIETALPLLSIRAQKRIPQCLEALERSAIVYLENGEILK